MPQPRVLLVDDDAAVRFSVGRYLSSKGFEVVSCENVATATEAFRARTPDATVIDYELPDGDALDLLKAFKEFDVSVPVVVLTGHGSIERAVRAMKQGADHFLVKPADLTALTITLERALHHRGSSARTRPATALRRARRIRSSASARQSSGCRTSRDGSPRRRPRCSSRARPGAERASSRAGSTRMARARRNRSSSSIAPA